MIIGRLLTLWGLKSEVFPKNYGLVFSRATSKIAAGMNPSSRHPSKVTDDQCDLRELPLSVWALLIEQLLFAQRALHRILYWRTSSCSGVSVGQGMNRILLRRPHQSHLAKQWHPSRFFWMSESEILTWDHCEDEQNPLIKWPTLSRP